MYVYIYVCGNTNAHIYIYTAWAASTLDRASVGTAGALLQLLLAASSGQGSARSPKIAAATPQPFLAAPVHQACDQ